MYVFFGLFLATYLIFPSFYVAVSQKVFTFWYARHAHFYPEVSGAFSVDNPVASDKEVPLYVIARPPQTPYDLLVVKAPDGYDEQNISRYVYHDRSVPVGYIAEMYSAVYAVTLFSAPESSEQFSVGDYVTVGVGQGGGGLSLQVPVGVSVSVGMPITHQATGSVVGSVVAVEDLPEKNIQRVSGALQVSPFQVVVLYALPGEDGEFVTDRSVAEAVEDLEQVTETVADMPDDESGTDEEGVGDTDFSGASETDAVDDAAVSHETESIDDVVSVPDAQEGDSEEQEDSAEDSSQDSVLPDGAASDHVL